MRNVTQFFIVLVSWRGGKQCKKWAEDWRLLNTFYLLEPSLFLLFVMGCIISTSNSLSVIYACILKNGKKFNRIMKQSFAFELTVICAFIIVHEFNIVSTNNWLNYFIFFRWSFSIYIIFYQIKMKRYSNNIEWYSNNFSLKFGIYFSLLTVVTIMLLYVIICKLSVKLTY